MDKLDKIWSFIDKNHVISLTAYSKGKLWSANLFYAHDMVNKCLWIMTSGDTEHGKLMKENWMVTGTISDQESNVLLLRGIQYIGNIEICEDKAGLICYQKRFPVAKLHKETLWKLTFCRLKYTNNTLGFGYKLNWNKEYERENNNRN